MRKLASWALGSIVGVSAIATSWGATTFTASDNNSSITVDAVPVPGFNYGGLIGWEVEPPPDGISSFTEQEWFWFRQPGDNREYAVADPLGGLTYVDGLASGNEITVQYRKTGVFFVELNYKIEGGAYGSGTSKLTETIRFLNLTTTPLALTWFEFNDFDLSYTRDNDTATASLDGLTQIDSITGVTLAITHSVRPDRFQLSGDVPAVDGGDPFLIFDDLEDGDVDDLSNAVGSLPVGIVRSAFQWELDLPVNEFYTLTITKEKVIPEPTTGLLVAGALGLLGLGLRRRA